MRQHPSGGDARLALSLVLAVAIAACLFAHVFGQTSQFAAAEEGQGLAPASDPIELLAIPWVTLVVAILLFAAIAWISSASTASRRTRIARGCALACAAGLGLVGFCIAGFGLVGGLVSGSYDDANLLGFGISVIGIVLMALAGVYMAVRATCRKSLAWRAFGAVIGLGVSWLLVSALISEAMLNSEPFWAGTAASPIYNPSPYGDWPLVYACAFGILWLAASIAVVVNALPVNLRLPSLAT